MRDGGAETQGRATSPAKVASAVHHTSRTVSDMSRALEFYVGLLGLTAIADEQLSGAGLEAATGVKDAVLRFVELGCSLEPPFIELLEYRRPRGQPLEGRAWDVGAGHIAVGVRDIHRAHEELSRAGVAFEGQPTQITTGFFTGDWRVYCLDPDDLVVELWQRRAPS
jgi:catechol 2,3-dioxygenase-like lactoylglutathione lyase family enzyme